MRSENIDRCIKLIPLADSENVYKNTVWEKYDAMQSNL